MWLNNRINLGQEPEYGRPGFLVGHACRDSRVRYQMLFILIV